MARDNGWSVFVYSTVSSRAHLETMRILLGFLGYCVCVMCAQTIWHKLVCKTGKVSADVAVDEEEPV